MAITCTRTWLVRLSLLLLTGLFLVYPDNAVAKPKLVELEPATPWHVDWTENTCVMRRGFGSKEDLLVLQIERFAPGNKFQLVITGQQLRGLDENDKLSIAYGSGEPKDYSHMVMLGTSGNGTPSLFISSSSLGHVRGPGNGFRPVTPKTEAAVRRISIIWVWKNLQLNTGPLDKAFEALRTCTDDLVKTWGLEPEQQRNLLRRPLPKSNPGDWLRRSDYPGGALSSGKQSIVNFHLTVDETGIPTQCRIQRSYSGKSFDETSCELLMRRARFEPALGKEGKPVASYYVNTIRWIIGRP